MVNMCIKSQLIINNKRLFIFNNSVKIDQFKFFIQLKASLNVNQLCIHLTNDNELLHAKIACDGNLGCAKNRRKIREYR